MLLLYPHIIMLNDLAQISEGTEVVFTLKKKIMICKSDHTHHNVFSLVTEICNLLAHLQSDSEDFSIVT